jgi:peptide-methionine (S)-S-oxide reductase
VIPYDRLLDVFWESADPTEESWSCQYRTAILVHGPEQRRIATESRDRLAKRLGKPVTTPIEDAGTFWRAEDYHQKFRLRNTPALIEQFRAIFPNDRDFVDSTAAARVNAYLDGCISREALEKELALLPEGKRLKLEP